MTGAFDWAQGHSRFPNVPFKRAFLRVDRNPPADAQVVTAFTDGQVTLRSNRDKIGYHEAADISTYKGVEVGDMVVHGLDILRGSVGVADSAGAISPVCTVCVSRPEVHSKYVAYAMRAQARAGLPRALARGVREGGADFRRWDTLGELPVPMPTFEEQLRIADFLDDQVARLDRTIALRRQQIQLSTESFLTQILDMLSGSNEVGNRQPTGWQWMPAIPDTWSKGPVYAYFDVRLGKMLNAERALGPNPKPYLRNANVHWFDINVDDLAQMSIEPNEQERYAIRKGDLMICEGGAGVAEAAVWDLDVECYYQKSLHRARATSHLPVEWLMYWLRVAKSSGVFESEGNLATIPHLTGEQLRESYIPIPPPGHTGLSQLQYPARTAEALETACARSLALLAERKQALITAAVTGEFDVSTARGVA